MDSHVAFLITALEVRVEHHATLAAKVDKHIQFKLVKPYFISQSFLTWWYQSCSDSSVLYFTSTTRTSKSFTFSKLQIESSAEAQYQLSPFYRRYFPPSSFLLFLLSLPSLLSSSLFLLPSSIFSLLSPLFLLTLSHHLSFSLFLLPSSFSRVFSLVPPPLSSLFLTLSSFSPLRLRFLLFYLHFFLLH